MEHYLMLVYCKEPMGYTSIDGKRIYGKYFNYGNFGATNISRRVFRKHRDVLEEVEYDERILEKIFGVQFPPVRFKISEFWKVEFDMLIEIARCLGIEYIKGKNNPTDIEKRALRRGILSKIA
jgi:hypothetical protein